MLSHSIGKRVHASPATAQACRTFIKLASSLGAWRPLLDSCRARRHIAPASAIEAPETATASAVRTTSDSAMQATETTFDSTSNTSGGRRRGCDHRVKPGSSPSKASVAIIELLQQKDGGAITLDAVGTESLPKAARLLHMISEMAATQLGKKITVQPFGANKPMGFFIAFLDPSAEQPALREAPVFVGANTQPHPLSRYIGALVIQERGAVVLQMTGSTALVNGMLAITKTRARVFNENLEEDLYCAFLPIDEVGEGTPDSTGRLRKAQRYRIAVYPCARVKTDSSDSSSEAAPVAPAAGADKPRQARKQRSSKNSKGAPPAAEGAPAAESAPAAEGTPAAEGDSATAVDAAEKPRRNRKRRSSKRSEGAPAGAAAAAEGAPAAAAEAAPAAAAEAAPAAEGGDGSGGAAAVTQGADGVITFNFTADAAPQGTGDAAQGDVAQGNAAKGDAPQGNAAQ